jgi:hypothetical protein
MSNMKKISLIFAFIAVYGFSIAQDCGIYHPSSVGKTLTYTYFKKAGKPESISTMAVTGVDKTAAGIKISVAGSVKDAKGKEAMAYAYDAWCDGDNFFIDMKSMVGSMAVKDMSSYKVESKHLKFPKNLSVGQKLEDASLSMTIEGPVSTGITSNITNRTVVAFEKITTSAGTFDCVKISYDIDTKVMFIKTNNKAVEWYAEGVGMVRSESFDKNGKQIGFNELTAIK